MDNSVFVASDTCNASKRHKSQRFVLKARIKARSKVQKKSNSVSTRKRKAQTLEKNGAEPKSPQVEAPLQVPIPDGEENKPRINGVEKVLEQLVSSLRRVEERVLSVEEHVKNPTSSIEARLKDIEQQLEKVISLENASAPGFSFRKSDDHDHDHDHFTGKRQNNVVGSDGFKCGENADCSSTRQGFIVAAPEFSDSDDVASPGSNCVVDKCETVNSFPENHVDGRVDLFDTNAPTGPGKRRSAKSCRIFTCFFCSGTKNPGCTF